MLQKDKLFHRLDGSRVKILLLFVILVLAQLFNCSDWKCEGHLHIYYVLYVLCIKMKALASLHTQSSPVRDSSSLCPEQMPCVTGRMA